MKKGTGRMPASAAFWIFLLIVMVIAFFMLLPRLGVGNREQITDNREEGTGNGEQGTEEKKPQAEKPVAEKTAAPEQKEPEKKPQAEKTVAEKPTALEQKEPEKKPQAEKPAAPEQPEKKPQTEKPAAQPSTAPAKPSTPPAQPSTPPVKPVETRDRSIYLIQKSNDGVLVLVRVNRKLNANTLTDSINALLAGPTPDEIMRGIESFVPEGSRLLSARVDDSTGTAHLSFNQEFRYNPRGREGCEAQIKQIVWTATEFPNVKDVQFLIEGQRVDFLSEGVPINRPIGR